MKEFKKAGGLHEKFTEIDFLTVCHIFQMIGRFRFLS